MARRQRKAIVLRHVAFEDLGLLAPILFEGGWDVAYCDVPIGNLHDPAIANVDLLIVLGGPIGVYDTDAYPFLAQEIAILERRLARGAPTLGICLGAQLIARALGARVFPGETQEIGWGRVALTEEGRRSSLKLLADPTVRVLHWHGDTFDLPEGAVRLAGNDAYENQAFSYGRQALALQFHIEVDPLQLEEWYVGHAVELAAANVSVKDLRSETAALADRLRHQADGVITPWLTEIAAAVPA